jgi:hypothetical protein
MTKLSMTKTKVDVRNIIVLNFEHSDFDIDSDFNISSK